MFDAAQAQAIQAWLNRLDVAHLHAFVAQGMPAKAPMRLGRYAERLMEYFLREAQVFELVVANVPLRRDIRAGDVQHTTVGEFDYLIRDAAGQPWHWELAVKFYLCHTTGLPLVPHDFKGPAGKDTLGLKLAKVFDKQLRHLPPAPYDTTSWQPAAYARGWMFYPHNEAVPACDALNPLHLKGWWLGIEGFLTAQWASAYFVHLPRLQWLAPCLGSDLAVMSHTQMHGYLQDYWRTADAKQAQAGQMLACVVSTDSGWQEISRGFVLPHGDAGAVT